MGAAVIESGGGTPPLPELPGRQRVSNEQIVNAYRMTGSVWKAGKALGVCGQSVHERLVALGYPMGKRHWTDDEIEEMRSLAGHVTIGEIAGRLGRTYAGVACKLSELGGSANHGRAKVKIPRGAGYDKASCATYIKQMDASGARIQQFARRQGLGTEMLVQAFERHFPDWWVEYRKAHSDLPERTCPYCGLLFVPNNGKQQFCTRKCGSASRVDESYFGGKRRATIGLAEGMCQLCGRVDVKGLSSHHVLGKENDPENDFLVALCPGCHNLVTISAGRPFLDTEQGWQSFISLVWLRRNGADNPHGVYVEVGIDALSEDDWLDEEADDPESRAAWAARFEREEAAIAAMHEEAAGA